MQQSHVAASNVVTGLYWNVSLIIKDQNFGLVAESAHLTKAIFSLGDYSSMQITHSDYLVFCFFN